MKRLAFSLGCIFVFSCAHTHQAQIEPSVEVCLDQGRASERPLTPSSTFEILMRIDPHVPAYVPRRIRFLLAQPGKIVFSVYAMTPDGRPGQTLLQISRSYGPNFTSSGKDGKWTVEPLELGPQKGPLWIGISGPGGSDPRLWATSNNSGSVFQREADPTVPLSEMAIPRTPMLRLEVAPTL